MLQTLVDKKKKKTAPKFRVHRTISRVMVPFPDECVERVSLPSRVYVVLKRSTVYQHLLLIQKGIFTFYRLDIRWNS